MMRALLAVFGLGHRLGDAPLKSAVARVAVDARAIAEPQRMVKAAAVELATRPNLVSGPVVSATAQERPLFDSKRHLPGPAGNGQVFRSMTARLGRRTSRQNNWGKGDVSDHALMVKEARERYSRPSTAQGMQRPGTDHTHRHGLVTTMPQKARPGTAGPGQYAWELHPGRPATRAKSDESDTAGKGLALTKPQGPATTPDQVLPERRPAGSTSASERPSGSTRSSTPDVAPVRVHAESGSPDALGPKKEAEPTPRGVTPVQLLPPLAGGDRAVCVVSRGFTRALGWGEIKYEKQRMSTSTKVATGRVREGATPALTAVTDLSYKMTQALADAFVQSDLPKYIFREGDTVRVKGSSAVLSPDAELEVFRASQVLYTSAQTLEKMLDWDYGFEPAVAREAAAKIAQGLTKPDKKAEPGEWAVYNNVEVFVSEELSFSKGEVKQEFLNEGTIFAKDPGYELKAGDVLFNVDEAEIALVSLDSGEHTLLVKRPPVVPLEISDIKGDAANMLGEALEAFLTASGLSEPDRSLAAAALGLGKRPVLVCRPPPGLPVASAADGSGPAACPGGNRVFLTAKSDRARALPSRQALVLPGADEEIASKALRVALALMPACPVLADDEVAKLKEVEREVTRQLLEEA